MNDRKLEEVGGVVVAHSTLIAGMVGMLMNKGLVTQDDVNQMLEVALTGAETADVPLKEEQRQARKFLQTISFGRPKPRRRS